MVYYIVCKNIRRDVEYSMSENFKKYFIKDSELTSIDQDKLSSKDIAKNISLIIDNTKPPFAVAVTGKSGIGKSSIINLVLEKYKKNPENYNVQQVNVWKEEDISLKSILSKYENNQTYANEYVNANVANSEKNVENVSFSSNNQAKVKINNPVLKTIAKVAKYIAIFLVCLLITSLIFIFMEYLQNANIYNSNDIFFVENTYLNYRENFGLIFIFSCGLAAIAFIINTLLNANKKQKRSEQVNMNVAEKRVEDTSINKIGNLNINSNYIIDSNKTNIIVLEDVDKLTASKMLKTLEEIKYCNDNSNCIIIAPFDEKVLNKAIDARNEIKLSGNYKPLKFEKVLDKLFQFKIYVPHISNGDIKDYAVELVKDSVPSFVDEYCEIGTFEKVIKNVLIYKDVTTPRHAKKLINNFINNKIMISFRANNGRIDESLLQAKNFDFQLAKISVIQSDFEVFYNILFKNFNYMEVLTDLYSLDIEQLRNVFDGIDEDLKQFFTIKYRPLRNFLKQTKNIQFDNISTLMYLTKVKTEVMFKDKRLYSYVSGEEDISELRIQEVVELVKLIDNKDDLKEFTNNNFDKLLDQYQNKCENRIFFMNMKEIVDITSDYINDEQYTKYMEIAAENYNYYPDEALEMFSNTKIEIPVSVMNVLFERIKQTLTKENYDKTFEFLRDNSEPFFEEDGNVSDYVQFLVNYINLSSNPTEVIQELDDNFTRIGKVYELNKNIKGLENLDEEKAYDFIAKCINNSDLDKTVNIFNKILSDEDSVEGCLKIEEKMLEYNLIDVIECNVDDILDGKFEGNTTLLKNLVDVASYKQNELDPTDVMKLIETALSASKNKGHILGIYTVLNKFDRMYFYEIRRDFNEVIYNNFHIAENKEVKKAALDCTRYFKNTRLFKTKLDKDEEKFYEEN